MNGDTQMCRLKMLDASDAAKTSNIFIDRAARRHTLCERVSA
jgi:hypothetical protein